MIEKKFGSKIEKVKYKDRIGAYAIIINGNKIAAVKVPRGYFLIGGKLEEKESYEECIKRESLEETGYELEVKECLCKSETHCYIEGYYRQICHYYVADIKDKLAEPIESDHIFEWVNIDDIDTKLHIEHQRWAVKQATNAI